jgi:acyl-CoA thioesterase I
VDVCDDEPEPDDEEPDDEGVPPPEFPFPKRAWAVTANNDKTKKVTRMKTPFQNECNALVAKKIHLAVALLLGSVSLAKNPISFVALGDSFTCGTGTSLASSFPSQLADKMKAKGIEIDVTNLAVNGYSTQELIDRELPALKTLNAQFVTLAVGANDIVRERTPRDYRKNLKIIFAALKEKSISQIIVLPQPDWSQSPAAESFGSAEKIKAQIVAYNLILKEETVVAKLELKLNARYLDLFSLFEEQAAQGLVAKDGLHPNAQAYDAWAVEIQNTLARLPRTHQSK